MSFLGEPRARWVAGRSLDRGGHPTWRDDSELFLWWRAWLAQRSGRRVAHELQRQRQREDPSSELAPAVARGFESVPDLRDTIAIAAPRHIRHGSRVTARTSGPRRSRQPNR
ncbi:hypothetical protein GCM10009609_48070 [Pseudonocardia aurantiaca]